MQKISKYLFYIFIAYFVIGFFILPFVLKSQLVKAIEQETKAKATITSLTFNPLLVSLEISGFKLTNPHNEIVVSFDKFYVNCNPSALLYGAIEFKRVSLIAPKVFLVYYKDKTINLLNLLKEKKSKKQKRVEQSSTFYPRVIVDSFEIEGGRLDYEDYTHKTVFRSSLENIGLSLKNFDTKKDKQKSTDFRLYAKLGDGGFVDLKSKILTIQPLKAEGSLTFEASKLYTEWRYVQDFLKLEVADGQVSFYANYSVNLDDIIIPPIN